MAELTRRIVKVYPEFGKQVVIRSIVQGPKGDPGPAGPAGPQGPAGEAGGVLNVPVPGPVGPAGPQGPEGIQGPVGIQGPKGLTGDTGLQGPAGPPGSPGVQGVKGDKGDDGDPGPAGPQGIQGVPGPAGIDGEDGSDGAPGAPGAAGSPGAQGPAGPQGEVGPAGADGEPGSRWFSSPTYSYTGAVPDPAEGDHFLYSDSGDVFGYTSGAWAYLGSIRGPQGEPGTGMENPVVIQADVGQVEPALTVKNPAGDDIFEARSGAGSVALAIPNNDAGAALVLSYLSGEGYEYVAFDAYGTGGGGVSFSGGGSVTVSGEPDTTNPELMLDAAPGQTSAVLRVRNSSYEPVFEVMPDGSVNPPPRPSLPPVFKTAAYTAAPGDFVIADASAGGFTVTLPASPSAGAQVRVKKLDASGNIVTIVATGKTINGDANATLVSEDAAGVFFYDGTNWQLSASYVSSFGGTTPTAQPALYYGSGRYYDQSYLGGSRTTFNTTVGRLFLVPTTIYSATTISELRVNVTTVGTAGAVGRIGIWNVNADGSPGALVYASSTFATTALGLVGVSGLTQYLPAGNYYFGFVSQTAVCTLSGMIPSIAFAGWRRSTTWSTAGPTTFEFMDGVTGALTATPATSPSAGTVLAIIYRIA